jgi:hypothetical protein
MRCVSLFRLVRSFTKTSPLRSSRRLLTQQEPIKTRVRLPTDSLLDVVAVLSSALASSEGHCHQLSTAATYSLLRVLPPPHTTFRDGLNDSCCPDSSFSRFAYGGANAAGMMPGFPSYCAGSLSVDHVSNHLLQLFLYRASRLFARSLLQPAESSLLTLRSR